MKYQLLSIWLLKNGIKKGEFAASMAVTASQVSHWIKNDFRVVDDGFGSCEMVKVHRRFNHE